MLPPPYREVESLAMLAFARLALLAPPHRSLDLQRQWPQSAACAPKIGIPFWTLEKAAMNVALVFEYPSCGLEGKPTPK